MNGLGRLLLDHNELMILLVEADSLRIAFANRTALQSLGYAEEDLRAKSILDIESALQDVFYWQDVQAGVELPVDAQEGLYLCADGTMRAVIKSIRPLEDEGRRWFLIQAREQRAELSIADELARTSSQLRAALEATGNGILVIDWQGRIASMNRLFSTLWRVPEDLLLARDDRAIVDYLVGQVENAETFRQLLADIVEDFEVETLFHLRDGRVFSGKSLPQTLDGRIIGRVFSFSDQTERIRGEQDLIAAREKAEAANRAKAAFLAMMSHEIRTPLNGVVGMTTLLRDTTLDPIQTRYLNVIQSSSRSLLSIINDILDFSKIEAQKMTLESIAFDLRALLDEFAEDYGLRARSRDLGFECVLDPALPTGLRGDPVRLRQILANLVGNALKFTTEGAVTLRVEAAPRAADPGQVRLRLSVEDSGIGIAADQLEAIFAPFEQGDTSITRKFGGTGLGLSITRQLVQLMGGEIAVSSTPGVGTRFELELPFLLQPAAPPAAMAAAPAVRRVEPNAACLLVVEDNLVNMTVILGLLGKLGYLSIDQAGDGNAALAAAAGRDYDLILMDCQMPELDGYDATRQLRERGVRVPVIAMTAHAMAGDREACLAAGMDDYLAKPIDLDELRRLLERWLPS